MRITNVLSQLNYLRYFRRLWKKQGKMQIQDLGIPPEILEKNVKVQDAKEILLETKLFKPIVADPIPRYMPKSVFKKEDNIFYKMNQHVQVSESEDQTLSLTKTVPYQGLPTILNSMSGIENVPNQDDMIQSFILQSFVWDCIQKKLPKRIDVLKPGWVFRREFGIRKERKSSNLLEKLSFHCDSVMGKYSDSFQRNKVYDAYSEVTIERGGDTIIFQMPCDILLTSKKPLKCFALSDAVKETKDLEVPNIYPIKCTLDLEKCDANPAKWQKVSHISSNNFVHTILFGQNAVSYWSPNQMLSRAIASCFSFAATEARRRYGDDVKILPEPISIQCGYMDLKEFNFIAYQLNTLDVSHNEGIKNQVWIDEPSTLYSDISEMNEVLDYNKNVISKILSLHLNGLHPISL